MVSRLGPRVKVAPTSENRVVSPRFSSISDQSISVKHVQRIFDWS